MQRTLTPLRSNRILCVKFHNISCLSCCRSVTPKLKSVFLPPDRFMITKCFVVRDAVGGSNIVTMMSAAATAAGASNPNAAPVAAQTVASNTINVVADSTCGSEFSDSGSLSSVSDDLGNSSSRIGTRFVVRNGSEEVHALMETDDGDEMGK